jgi:hypothetical protein
LFLFAAVGLLAGALIVATPVADARTTYPLDPPVDVPLTSQAWGPACTAHPLRRTCERIMIHALNHARSVIGQPAYELPDHFGALRAREQLLVLANLDRKLYHRAPIAGLNPTLNASAERGADAGGDPAFVPVGGRTLARGAANWAGGLRSPLAAYFLWMYDDASEAWQHRHTVLMRKGDAHNVLIMGAGSSPDGGGMPSWTLLLESFAPNTLIQCVPTVVSLLVRPATAGRGPLVQLFGFGFLHVRRVTFDGVPASFDRTSLFTITAVPPPHAAGRVHVRVVTRGGTSSATGAAVYTY